MNVVLKSGKRPEYGAYTIPLPIPDDQYEEVIHTLEVMGIGSPTARDCLVEEIAGEYPVLKQLEGALVNIEELDYLAKRLDSFCFQAEGAQFQAMASKLALTDMTDFINLTFCCQQATVLADFSNLEKVGKDHYLNTHGGCVGMEEYTAVDGYETALLLIEGGGGTITPYGVVYDNGMKLEPVYDGRHLPCYHYADDLLAVGIASGQEPEDTERITWLVLPCPKLKLERDILRSGIDDLETAHIWYEDSSLPHGVEEVLDGSRDSLSDLNDMATAIIGLSQEERTKLDVALTLAEPENAHQIQRLAEYLDLFDFVPGVSTPEEYGRYMIQQSGHFEYDANLEEFYDYESYGRQKLEQSGGCFTAQGYITYCGAMSLDKLMAGGSPTQGLRMGGLGT